MTIFMRPLLALAALMPLFSLPVMAQNAPAVTSNSQFRIGLGLRYTCPVEESHQSEFFETIESIIAESEEPSESNEQFDEWKKRYLEEVKNWKITFSTGESPADQITFFINEEGEGRLERFDKEADKIISTPYDEAPEKMLDLFGLLLERPQDLGELSMAARCEFGTCAVRPRDDFLNEEDAPLSRFLKIGNRDYREANWVEPKFKDLSVEYTHRSLKTEEGEPVSLKVDLSQSVMARMASFLEFRKQERRNWTTAHRHESELCLFKNDCSNTPPKSQNLDKSVEVDAVRLKVEDAETRIQKIRELLSN